MSLDQDVNPIEKLVIVILVLLSMVAVAELIMALI